LKTGKGDAALNRRVDATSAYKCTPLNPDTQIKDGKIVVDTQKGELLSQVLQERTADLSAEAPSGGLTPGDIQKVIAIAFGIGFGLLILSLLAYFVSIYSTGEGSFPEGDVISIPEWMSNIGPSIAIAVIGFIVGAIAIGLIKK
jgi:Na+-transporting methylmalonyl-CoA/oxaloacetate decarboxylase gamma subunit